MIDCVVWEKGLEVFMTANHRERFALVAWGRSSNPKNHIHSQPRRTKDYEMAKSKARKHARTTNNPYGLGQARNNNPSGGAGNKKKPQPAAASKQPAAQTKKSHHHQQALHDKPIIPFRRSDRILLIGEGMLAVPIDLISHG